MPVQAIIAILSITQNSGLLCEKHEIPLSLSPIQIFIYSAGAKQLPCDFDEKSTRPIYLSYMVS